MPCEVIHGKGSTTFLCSRGKRGKSCSVSGCRRKATKLCDYNLRGAKAGKTWRCPVTRYSTRAPTSGRPAVRHLAGAEGAPACGARRWRITTSHVADVTCKRCRAAMARDSARELEIKTAMARPMLRCDLCSRALHADVFLTSVFACPFCLEGTMKPVGDDRG